MHRTDKLILAGLVATAGIAGALSYGGLWKFAEQTGQSMPGLWPLALDLPAVILSMAVWRARQLGRSAWGARFGVLALAGVSTVLQVSTAGASSLAGQIGHGLPPVVLLVLWESVLWLQAIGAAPVTPVRSAPAADNVKVTQPVRSDSKADKTQERPAPQPASSPRPAPVSVDTDDRLAPVLSTIRAMQVEGEEVTARTLAKRLGVTERTGRRHLARPEVASILEIPAPKTLDSSDMLARTGACEDRSEQSPPLSAPDVAMSGASAGSLS